MALNLDDNKRPYFKQLGLDETFDEIQAAVNTPLVYAGIMTQSGTNAPTVTVIRNDFDMTWVWDGPGYFYGSAAGIDAEKMIVTGLDFTKTKLEGLSDVKLVVSETAQFNYQGIGCIEIYNWLVEQDASEFIRTSTSGLITGKYFKVEVY